MDEAKESIANKPAVKVRLYRFRNKLKEKIAGGGGVNEQAAEIDESAMLEAEKLFQELAEDYPDWANKQISELYELHRRCVDTPEQRRRLFESITEIAHDLRGQGGTFGYPLISNFATSLNSFSATRHDFRDSHVEIIKAHIDAMRAVIRDRIQADGGALGVALLSGLEQVISNAKN